MATALIIGYTDSVPIKIKRMNRFMFVAMAFVGISLSSCTKGTVVSPSSTIFITANRWVTTNNGLTYTASIAVADITNYYQSNGAVLLFRMYGERYATVV